MAAGRNGQARMPRPASTICSGLAQGLLDQRPKASPAATAARTRPPKAAPQAAAPAHPSAKAVARPPAAKIRAPSAQRTARTLTVSGRGTGPRRCPCSTRTALAGSEGVLTCFGGSPARGAPPAGSSAMSVVVSEEGDFESGGGRKRGTASGPAAALHPGPPPAPALLTPAPPRRC